MYWLGTYLLDVSFETLDIGTAAKEEEATANAKQTHVGDKESFIVTNVR